MPRSIKNRVYDVMHKTTVGCLVSFCVITTGYMVYGGAKYYWYTRPQLMKESRLRLEEEMEQKQQEREMELNTGKASLRTAPCVTEKRPSVQPPA